MNIRALTSEDAQVLQACRLAALQESPEAFAITLAEVRDTSLAQVQAELGNANIHYVGAFADEQLLGFMRFIRSTRMARRHTAEVHSVFVQAAHRRRGLARALLARLIEDARADELESLTLAVLADNVAARCLYESLGFKVIGVEPRAIRKGDVYLDQVWYWHALVAC